MSERRRAKPRTLREVSDLCGRLRMHITRDTQWGYPDLNDEDKRLWDDVDELDNLVYTLVHAQGYDWDSDFWKPRRKGGK